MKLRDLAQPGLFGLIDGLNGMVGLVIGLTRSHAAAVLIFVAILSRAGSSAVSMAGAQYASGEQEGTPGTRWARVAAMGLGYLTSALGPGLGFAIGASAGWLVFIPASAAVLAGVTWFRSGQAGWVKATVTTAVIFALAVGAGLLASLAG